MEPVSTNVETLSRGRRRERRLEPVIEARRRLADTADVARHGGRAWINGEEVGGVDPRLAHLSTSYD